MKSEDITEGLDLLGDWLDAKRHMIDPPSGWKYGFPKEIPDDVEDTIAWLLENGYPQHEIDACGEHFYCRHYNEEDEVDRLKAIASKAIREQIPLGEEIDRLQAENEALREALKRYEDEADSLRKHWPITHD